MMSLDSELACSMASIGRTVVESLLIEDRQLASLQYLFSAFVVYHIVYIWP